MSVNAETVCGLRHVPTSRGVLRLTQLLAIVGTFSSAAISTTPFRTSAQTVRSAERTLRLDAARNYVTSTELEAHTRFIASDALLGRAPGTVGGRVAAHYVASQFERIGLEPGGTDGTYFQRVPLVGVTSSPVVLVGDGAAATSLTYPDDFVARPERPDSLIVSGGSVLFVGHGIRAPESGWDDYKDTDVSGRVLFILPGRPSGSEGNYAGLRYKLELAEAAGARGVFFVHTDAVPVPWEVVRNQWTREIVRADLGDQSQLDFIGWISSAAVQQLAAESGLDWNVLARRASLREFRPAAFNLHLAIDITSSVRTFEAENVVGLIRGYELPQRSVVITAHHDYLGVERGVRGDSIFNGARGSAGNLAALMTTAGAFTSAGLSTPTTLRFVASTAGESGGLGLESFLWSLSANHESAQAAVVFREPNLWGSTADIAVAGQRGIEADPAVQRAARLEGLIPSPAHERFEVVPWGNPVSILESAGVPFAAIESGWRLSGGNPGGRELAIDAFYSRHYGRTSDNMLSDFDFDALRSQTRFAITLSWELAKVAAAATN